MPDMPDAAEVHELLEKMHGVFERMPEFGEGTPHELMFDSLTHQFDSLCSLFALLYGLQDAVTGSDND